MNMKMLQKNVEKFKLQEPITLEELYEIMVNNSEKMPGKFKLKKGLLGKAIVFDVFMQTQPRITLKDKIVTVRRMGSQTTVGIGNMPKVDFKGMKQRIGAVKKGGFGKAISGGAEYFSGVCDAMREILKDQIE